MPAYHSCGRSEADIASVVEQRVQQAFREGEFEKLHGSGKPLLEQSHPYNDPADEMAYRLLKKSGFAPDWVELNRDIRFQIRRWRKGLEIASIWRHEGGFQRESWGSVVSRLEEELVQINKKVAHYNLIVPYGRQVRNEQFNITFWDTVIPSFFGQGRFQTSCIVCTH